eukprot:Hpha_TRINITY_DN28085_c0_g1::TRINITY_DN28085_c0_g1_i1::g.42607::m.42607
MGGMDSLAAAIERMAVGGEGTEGIFHAPSTRREGRAGRVAGGGRSGLGYRMSSTPVPTLSQPYARPPSQRPSHCGVDALINSLQSLVLDPGANGLCGGGCGSAGCSEAELREAMLQRAAEVGGAPGETLDQAIALLSGGQGYEGEANFARYVPWRLCVDAADTNTFVFVAPHPRRYSEAQVFRLRADEGNCCAARVTRVLECRFKAWWELSHLMSLGGPAAPAYRARMPFTQRLIARLSTALRRACDGAPPSELCRPRPEHRDLQRSVFLIGGPPG